MLDNLIEYVTSDDKICPHPWNELYLIISQEAKARGVSEKVHIPLILSGWYASRDIHKRQRLIDQIRYSAKYGFLNKTDSYLRSLSDEDWYTCPEELINRPSAMELAARVSDEQQKIMVEARERYAELISIENISIYEEGGFGGHMRSFSIVHDDLGIEPAAYSDILKAKIRELEDLTLSFDDVEKKYWARDIAATRATILKLELLQLCKQHADLDLGAEDIFDFCEDIFLD
jgi:hypothetical protein